jgi:hypothetical protein
MVTCARLQPRRRAARPATGAAAVRCSWGRGRPPLLASPSLSVPAPLMCSARPPHARARPRTGGRGRTPSVRAAGGRGTAQPQPPGTPELSLCSTPRAGAAKRKPLAPLAGRQLSARRAAGAGTPSLPAPAPTPTGAFRGPARPAGPPAPPPQQHQNDYMFTRTCSRACPAAGASARRARGRGRPHCLRPRQPPSPAPPSFTHARARPPAGTQAVTRARLPAGTQAPPRSPAARPGVAAPLAPARQTPSVSSAGARRTPTAPSPGGLGPRARAARSRRFGPQSRAGAAKRDPGTHACHRRPTAERRAPPPPPPTRPARFWADPQPAARRPCAPRRGGAAARPCGFSPAPALPVSHSCACTGVGGRGQGARWRRLDCPAARRAPHTHGLTLRSPCKSRACRRGSRRGGGAAGRRGGGAAGGVGAAPRSLWVAGGGRQRRATARPHSARSFGRRGQSP